jgi:hypothetical protein
VKAGVLTKVVVSNQRQRRVIHLRAEAYVVSADRDWLAALDAHDAVEVPAAEDRIGSAAPRHSNRPALAEGQAIDPTGNELVGRVEAGERFVQPAVVHVGHATDVVDRFRPGVGRQEVEVRR